MDFVHPTVAEFFYARSISFLSSDQIIAFASENAEKEEIFEVFRLLIGLLRDQNKQKPLLDYLEENNLVLFLKCLDGRYHADVDNMQYYPDIEKQYLLQMQSSYNALLDCYFNKSKILFPPFRGHLFNQSKIDNLKVKVVGALDANQETLSYKYSFVDPLNESVEPEINSSLPVIVAVSFGKDENTRLYSPRFPIMASSSSDGCNYINLHMARLGLDSAREIVVNDIKNNLKNLIDKNILMNTWPLICEQLISEIHRAASTARRFQDKILEPIWNYESGIYDANEYHEIFMSIRQHPFVQFGNRKKPLGLKGIMSKLEFLIKNSIDISKYSLPEFRTNDFQYSPIQIKKRIEIVYSILPKIYSDMVDANFPNLKKYLWHCSIYPFKYLIYINKNNYTIDNREYTINASYCMPVMHEEKMDAIVNMSEKEINIDYYSVRREFIAELKTLRRFPLGPFLDEDNFYITGTSIVHTQ